MLFHPNFIRLNQISNILFPVFIDQFKNTHIIIFASPILSYLKNYSIYIVTEWHKLERLIEKSLCRENSWSLSATIPKDSSSVLSDRAWSMTRGGSSSTLTDRRQSVEVNGLAGVTSLDAKDCDKVQTYLVSKY